MTVKSIMGLVPTIQAASLVGENLKVAKKKDKNVGDMIGLGMKNIVGTSLIKVESDLIAGL
jgi:hypothetical protein